MQEAQMETTEAGLRPASEGWFVVNVADAMGETRHEGVIHAWFESETVEFPHFGINVTVLEDGVPNCLYHRESPQEAFLVLDGSPKLLVEGEERQLRRWDFFYCAPDTEHVCVGPGVILMVGARPETEEVHYPVSELAAKYGASAAAPSDSPKEAYPAAGWSREYTPVKMPWPS
jgi:uncharacterized cupin superfamily protein